MTNTRIATTVTNVKEGTLGARCRHSIAVGDVAETAREQLRLAREAGEITEAQYGEARKAVNVLQDLSTKVLLEVSRRHTEETQAALAAYEQAKADRLVAAGHLRGCKGTHGLGVFCTVAPEDQTEANGYVTR